MKQKSLIIVVFFFAVGLCSAANSFAALYKYTDKVGAMYFVDDLQAIPEEYRSAAVIVVGAEKEEGSRPANQQQTVPTETRKGDQTPVIARETPVPVSEGKTSFGGRALISTVVIVSALFVFFILREFEANHEKVVKVARIVMVWGVSMYLLYAHTGDVVEIVSSLGNKVERIQQVAEEKGKKAGKSAKELKTLMEQAEKNPIVNPSVAELEKLDGSEKKQ